MKTLSTRLPMLAAAAALGLAMTPMTVSEAEAQRQGERWRGGHVHVPPGQRHRAQPAHPRASDVPMMNERRHGQRLRPGYNARHYQRLPPRGHRLGHAPRGQHYRVINGQVALVDDRTLQVVAIVGLLSLLLNS